MSSILRALAFLVSTCLACAAMAQPASTGPAPAIASRHAARHSAALSIPPSGPAHALTAEDLDSWLDGLMPYAIGRGDIASAEIVVVKNGRVLFEKGYGVSDVRKQTPVDPRTTLFRPGSISKLFTWTAVMQLAEQHKLDLDRDINAYLDFRIPAAFGKPVTLRNLMTHTAGFEEAIKNLIARDGRPLDVALKAWVPERIYPPGEISAYSNYGAALAGYIVQRVSGEPFANYIEHHILQPLGMRHSTFEQPLPKSMLGGMSTGYRTASGTSIPFEMIAMSPAGALSTTADDMARFMITHLQDGAYGNVRILKPETARLMRSEIYKPVPGMPAMGLGFYHEDRNGHVVVGHGGDTVAFHSDLHIIPDSGVGFYFAQNSAGEPNSGIRGALYRAFMDRYFPPPPLAPEATLASAKEDAKQIAGYYWASRRSDSNFFRIGDLLQGDYLTANDDGTISVDVVTDLAGNARKWREVAPGRWREVNGRNSLIVTWRGGRVARIDTDYAPPIMVISPVPFWRSPQWNLPLLAGSVIMLALVVLFWPIKAVLRWRYGVPFPYTGRAATLYRLTRVVALIDLAFVLGWAVFLQLGTEDLSVFSSSSDPILRGLQGLGVLGVLGSFLPLVNFRTALGDPERQWWTKATDLLTAVACLAIVWFAFSQNLLTVSLNY